MNQSPIGIMQGRLSAPPPDRIQAFPRSSWADEFDHARALGLDTIEWLFEADRFEQNPIWTDEGLAAIEARIAETGVAVRTLCADYFMVHPFFRVTSRERDESVAVLRRLLPRAARLGIRVILMPVLEIAEVRTPDEARALVESLRGPLDVAAGLGMSIGLETELPAAAYRALVESAGHPALGVYYDTGNAASRGYDTVADLAVLGDLVRGIHLKDRTPGGP
ncbi:MAG: sugar phosphate isomerase/epimerase family protein, partial [Vicinamibacterales bacterium]